jgi:hypothetical protein
MLLGSKETFRANNCASRAELLKPLFALERLAAYQPLLYI